MYTNGVFGDGDFYLVVGALSGNICSKLTGGIVQSWPGKITKTEIVNRPADYVKTLMEFKMHMIIAIVVLMLVLFYLLGNLFVIPLEYSLLSRQKDLKIENKRKDIIVDVTEIPEDEPGATVIPVNTQEDLVRVSDSFFKPILRRPPAVTAEPWYYYYYVLDGSTRYEYWVIQEGPASQSNEDSGT